MFCKYCGAELEENQTVCTSCGKDNAEPAVPAEPAAEQAAPKTEKPKKKNTGKIILAIVSVLVVGGILAGVLLMGTKGAFRKRENDIQYRNSYTYSEWRMKYKRDDVVAVMGDKTLTNSQLQVFYWMQVYDFLNYTQGYASYYGLDIRKPLDEQMYDEKKGLTWQQYFLEAALNSWHRYTCLVNEAEKNGFQLPADQQKQLDEMEKSLKADADKKKFDSVDAMLQDEMGYGVTYADYAGYMKTYFVGNLYFNSIIEKLEAGDAEMEAYFTKHEAELKNGRPSITKTSGKLLEVRHILIPVPGGVKEKDENGKEVTKHTDEEWEKCRTEAQKVYDEWLNGKKTEETFIELAKKNSKDPGSASNGGLYQNVYKGQMVKEFDEWCFSKDRKAGDHGLVKTEFGYHILYYVGGEEGWIRHCKQGVINDKASQILLDYGKLYPIEKTYKAIAMGAPDLSQDVK